MLRTLLICTALGAFAGCAGTPAAPPAPQAAAAKNSVAQKNCVTSASRIPGGGCAAGQSFNQQDLDRTGRINPADALRMLDPAVH